MAVPHRIYHHQPAKNWWSGVYHQYRGVLRLAQSEKSDFQRMSNPHEILQQVKYAYDVFEQTHYPQEAETIRRHMLAIMTNLIACLQHAYHDNTHERDVIFEIMQVDTHMLDIALTEQSIAPLS